MSYLDMPGPFHGMKRRNAPLLNLESVLQSRSRAGCHGTVLSAEQSPAVAVWLE